MIINDLIEFLERKNEYMYECTDHSLEFCQGYEMCVQDTIEELYKLLMAGESG